MCSIFAYIARGRSTASPETLARIVRANIARGPHSFGLAWVDTLGRLHCYKQLGKLTDDLPLLYMVRDAKLLIGHLRYATHGQPEQNINNHPHPADSGWLVHNGVIRNYRQLLHARDLQPVSQCDSEILGLLIESAKSTSLLKRSASAVQATDGALCMMGLWSRPGTLIVARRGNPLHQSDTPSGIYLATLATGLPAGAVSLADHTIRRFIREGGAIRIKKMPLNTTDPTDGGLYDEEGNYRGG